MKLGKKGLCLLGFLSDVMCIVMGPGINWEVAYSLVYLEVALDG